MSEPFNPASPPPEPAAPTAPKIVSKTPLKTPREIQLEKRVATMEDELSGLKDGHNALTKWLADVLPGGKPPPPAREPAAPAASPSRKTISQEINGILGWED